MVKPICAMTAISMSDSPKMGLKFDCFGQLSAPMACPQLADRPTTHRIAPIARNFGSRPQDKVASRHLRVRDREPLACKSAAAPHHNIKIDHPRPPRLANPFAPESGFDVLEHGEALLRRKIAFDQSRSIGELPLRRAQRAADDCWRKSHDPHALLLQCCDCRIKHSARQSIARVAHIGAKANQIEFAQMSSAKRP